MKKIFTCLGTMIALAAILAGPYSCKGNDDGSPATAYSVEFKNLGVEAVQHLVQGKWKVVSASGGFSGTSSKITGVFIQFIDTLTWRITSQSSTTDYTIRKWEKSESQSFGGVILTIDAIPSTILLVSLHNDTLRYNDALADGFSYDAVKVEN